MQGNVFKLISLIKIVKMERMNTFFALTTTLSTYLTVPVIIIILTLSISDPTPVIHLRELLTIIKRPQRRSNYVSSK